MTDTFESILRDMKEEQQKLLSQDSMEWYLKQIKEVASKLKMSTAMTPDLARKIEQETKATTNRQEQRQLLKDNVIETNSTFAGSYIGKMIFFAYEPKHMATLPYYDMFPLIFPLKIDHNSTLGMNLHYLPPLHRARLMTALYALINTKEMNENSKLLVTYKVLKGVSKYRNFQPCIKRYLHGHVASRLMIINPKSWNQVLLMPIAGFQKKTENQVWQDSIDAIRKMKY